MKPIPQSIRCLPLLAALALPATAATQAPSGVAPLGTLFFSSAERDAVVAARRGETASPLLSADGSWIRLQGVVKRDRQRGTAWINGQPLPEGQAVDGAGVPALHPKQVTVEGRTVRVGESINLEAGTRADLLPGGSLTVRKGK